MGLDNIVTLNISRSAPAVSRQGFGTALILGSAATGWSGDRIRTYTNPDSLLTDGFQTTDPEYKAATELYGQDVKPVRFKVGLRTADVAQIDTITPTPVNSTNYIVTIDGVAYTYMSDSSATAAEIVAGLIALINADLAAVPTASGTTSLILTADNAGQGFAASVGDHMALVHSTPNSGPATDLATISAIDDDWYWLILCARSASDILAAASWIEGKRKVFQTAVSDAGIIAAGTTDVGSQLKARDYYRTGISYSLDQAKFPEAADIGALAPLDVGSWTQKFTPRKGIAPDPLTDSQQTIAAGKNVNIYVTVAGANIVSEGVVASGEFLDAVVGIDWIYANIQADIFQMFLDNSKIPFTDQGGTMFFNVITQRLQLAEKAGILTDNPKFVVFVPRVKDLDPADKILRRFSGIKFTAYLAGAVHATTINGTVAVAL